MRITHPKCGKSWVGLKLEHCAVCCETFTNTAAGDAHRTEDFRCLTPEEMRSRPRRPLAQNDRGYWTFAANLVNAPNWLSVFTKEPQTDESGV